MTRERAPLGWAATQNNLGSALTALGERGSGTARLEEAVKAFRDALKEWTRERVPLDWAMTQNNLGSALSRIGEREGDPTRLEEAFRAFRDALEEMTRERAPVDWAMTQSNLGLALILLGERQSETQLTLEVPPDRVMTQSYFITSLLHDPGSALASLGERKSSTALLEEAVRVLRDALLELTRERVPLQWARVQTNLGLAFWRLGERESGTARLEEAVKAFRDVLEEMTLGHGSLESYLSAAQALLNERLRLKNS